jgi:transposase
MFSGFPNAETLLAGRGYDADWFRNALKDRRIAPCIPSRRGRKVPIPHDPDLYRKRHRIENGFARLEASSQPAPSQPSSCSGYEPTTSPDPRHMPEHVLMSEIEIVTDGGRRRRWSSNEKMRIVEETLEEDTSILRVARRNGVASNLLCRWGRLMLHGGAAAVSGDDDVTSNRAVRQMEERIREFERQLGRKTLEVEILKEALDKSRSKKRTWLAQSQPKDGSR